MLNWGNILKFSMREKIEQMIFDLLQDNIELKLTLRNFLEELTENEIDEILDRIARNNMLIDKLKMGLNSLK
jgi:hypothetical protein